VLFQRPPSATICVQANDVTWNNSRAPKLSTEYPSHAVRFNVVVLFAIDAAIPAHCDKSSTTRLGLRRGDFKGHSIK
jgi:hypothetical protein